MRVRVCVKELADANGNANENANGNANGDGTSTIIGVGVGVWVWARTRGVGVGMDLDLGLWTLDFGALGGGLGLGTWEPWDLGTWGDLFALCTWARQRNLDLTRLDSTLRLPLLGVISLPLSLSLQSPSLHLQGPRSGSRARAPGQGTVTKSTIEIPDDPAADAATCQVPPQITSRK